MQFCLKTSTKKFLLILQNLQGKTLVDQITGLEVGNSYEIEYDGSFEEFVGSQLAKDACLGAEEVIPMNMIDT